jgi:hypothetical protein
VADLTRVDVVCGSSGKRWIRLYRIGVKQNRNNLLPGVFVLFVILLSVDCIYSSLELDAESISLLRIPIECNQI